MTRSGLNPPTTRRSRQIIMAARVVPQAWLGWSASRAAELAMLTVDGDRSENFWQPGEESFAR